MSTTESGSDSDFNADPTVDIDVVAQPAAVAWEGQGEGERRFLTDVHFDLHYTVRANKAFFKLRTAVALKATHPRKKTNVFLFIDPERIRRMTFDEDAEESRTQGLWPETVCLRFDLRRPPALVTPRIPLAPRNKASGDNLDSIRALARQTSFVVLSNIPSRTLPRARVLSLCDEVCSGRLRSISAHANTANLYGGKGGKIVEDNDRDVPGTAAVGPPPAAGDAHPEALSGNPPSYDVLGPSPPPASEAADLEAPRKKRRRDDLESIGITPDRKYIEEICSALLDRRLEDLRRDLTEKLEDLENRLFEHVDDAVGGLRDDVRVETGNLVDEEYYCAKSELKDYIHDEMRDAEDRIKQDISNAKVSMRFN